MRQPWYTKLISYVYDVHLETLTSELHDALSVFYVKGEYQLCTPEAIYSYGKRYDNYYKALEAMSLPEDGARVLLLGLGLGSIPWILEKHFHKAYDYTAVELDHTVIELAEKYTLDELDSPILTYATDALHYVQLTEEHFDLIMVDVFLGDEIPEAFESQSFLEDVKECLEPDGKVLLNRLYLYDYDKEDTDSYYDQVFTEVFDQTQNLEVGTNRMLIGG